jgi:hypothetical protein
MQRRLTFDGEKAAARFAFLYEALLAFGDGKSERSRAIVRQEARILDALEPISVPDPSQMITCEACGRRGNEDARVLCPGTHTVTLGQEDHELLVRYVDKRPWLPRVARTVVDVQDWLSAAERIEG